MYHPVKKLYMPDYEGMQVILDIEAAALEESNGEIYQISLLGFNNALGFKKNWHISPKGYDFIDPKMQAKFIRNPEAYEFNARQANWETVYNNGIPPEQAALEFTAALQELFESSERPVVLYVRGTDYDLPNIRNFLRAFNLQTPWHYRNVRDLRTLFAMVPAFYPRTGNHTAEEDVKIELHNIDALAMIHNMRQYFYGT